MLRGLHTPPGPPRGAGKWSQSSHTRIALAKSCGLASLRGVQTGSAPVGGGMCVYSSYRALVLSQGPSRSTFFFLRFEFFSWLV